MFASASFQGVRTRYWPGVAGCATAFVNWEFKSGGDRLCAALYSEVFEPLMPENETLQQLCVCAVLSHCQQLSLVPHVRLRSDQGIADR